MSDNSFFETDFENNPENNSDSRGANLEEGKNSLKSNQNADQETEIEGLGLNTLEDKVEPNILETVMQSSYLNYAMSVIVSRALPDVRDGLKPVHRRVIYVMNRLGLTPGAKYKKSAQVVGEVLGKFHPHGDVAVYDSLVRMAQEFSLRYPLVDGQGNFGSIDGDSAAAMRYTECRLNRPAVYLTQDLDKDTVDFVDNYDGSQKEPEVLPNLFPNLLVNGSTGIAVGMATNIPPHNLHEVSRAILHLLDNPEAEAQDLMEFIKGPDLPTGGIIYGQNDILQAYQTGRGKCTVRSKAKLEEDRIVITEIPYQINKAVMIEKMADLVRDKKVEGIRDIRDESNKQGIRIVIEVKRDVSPEVVLNLLYKQTDLQVNLHFNLVALIREGRQPKVLTLKEILQEFLAHRFKIIVRRTQYELNKNKAELHILDGLKLALDFIEEVIKIIRGSFDKQEAAEKLQKRFDLSDKQTEAILQMRLQTLTSLDKNKIEDQRQKLLAEIIELQKILDHESVRKDLVKSELEELLSRFSSERRSQIVAHGVEDYNKEDFITEETVLVQLTQQQYLKVMPMDLLRQQGRGGKGVSSFNAKDEDWVRQSFVASTHDVVYAFTNSGRVFRSRVFDLPGGSRTGRGQNLVNYFELKDGEKITNILTINKDQEAEKIGDLIFATEKGIVKRTALEEYQNVNRKGIIAIGLKDGDRLVDVGHSGENSDNIILSADNGKTVIFSKESLSQIGRAGQGVKGIRLKNQDKLISLQISQFDFTEGEEE